MKSHGLGEEGSEAHMSLGRLWQNGQGTRGSQVPRHTGERQCLCLITCGQSSQHQQSQRSITSESGSMVPWSIGIKLRSSVCGSEGQTIRGDSGHLMLGERIAS